MEAVLDRGWENYDPAVDDVDVVETIEVGDIEWRPWSAMRMPPDGVEPVASIADLRVWLRANGMTVAEFKETGIYLTNFGRPGFEWLEEL